MQALDWIKSELEQLQQQAAYRQLHTTKLLKHGWVEREGKRLLNLASNDYLGLSQESLLEMALNDCSGAAASRLVVGSDPVYERFEAAFAAYKQTEACLIFSNGYMANIGIITALVGRNDIIFSDRLNHASIVDGAILSRAEHIRYKHRDIEHLEKLLQRTDPTAKKLIVTDAVFSMDGDVAPLRELVQLKNRYGAMLMVDEAHSGGIYGEQGQGLVHQLGLTDNVEVIMGTFSKAYGSYGAYAAGSRLLIDYFVNKARSFIYTTALPSSQIIAVEQRWQQLKQEHWRRARLLEHAQRFRTGLQQAGYDTGHSESHIIPLILGSNKLAFEFSNQLQQYGIAAVAIRPPTVPEGTARIRFSLMSVHTDEHIEWALEQIIRIGKELKV